MLTRATLGARTGTSVSRRRAAWCTALLLCLAASTAAAQPEDPGEFAFEAWSAGVVSAAGARIPTRVYHPTGPAEQRPLIFVMHGWARLGYHWRVLGETLASRGFVAVVPDMPCSIGSCDHAANAEQITALLTWAIEQSEEDTPIAGRVDPERIGVIGHSWGALAVLLAAADDDRIDSVVLLDPNDDGGVALPALDQVHAPTATLLAERLGSCNSAWRRDRDVAADARLQFVVPGAAHCDPEAPGDLVCPIACGGSGDPSLAWVFRRYAVAWTACALEDDEAMAAYAGGDALDEDEALGLVDQIRSQGLDGLRCRGGAPTPGDVGGADAGGEEVGVGDEVGVADGADEEVGVADGGSDTGTSDRENSSEPADTAPDSAGTEVGSSGARGACAAAAGRGPVRLWILALVAVRRTRRG